MTDYNYEDKANNEEFYSNMSRNENNQPLKTVDYQEQAIKFATDSIQGLQDGDQITIEYSQNNSKITDRIDLHKGITKVVTSKKSTSSISSLIGWKGIALGLLISIPWFIGVHKMGKTGVSFVRGYI